MHRCYVGWMRTTVSLEPDVHELISRRMRERGITFKDAVNEAIRAGLRPSPPRREHRTPTFDLGIPTVPLTKAIQLAAELEDEEIVRKMAIGK